MLAEKLYDPATANVEKYEIEQRAQKAIEAASNAFYRLYPPRSKRGMRSFEARRVMEGERFLEELARTIANAAEVDTTPGQTRPSYLEQYPAGERNAATLIQYMTRYGLEFGKARAGTEHLYDRLFLQYRDLARLLNAAPKPESVTAAMIDIDLDEILRDESDDWAGPKAESLKRLESGR